MKRFFAFASVIGFSMAGLAATSTSASAVTVNGLACQSIDTKAAVGTVILYSMGEDCSSTEVTVLNGSPTYFLTPGSGGPLVWRKEIERASTTDACPSGWNPTWADWASNRKGGPTCVQEVFWGQSPRQNPVITVIINTESDHIQIDANQQWATGCAVDLSADPYTVNDSGCVY